MKGLIHKDLKGSTGAVNVVMTGTDGVPYYKPLTDFALAAHSHSWAQITGKPTTLTGYGIKAEADSLYAPMVHTHDWASITNKPTTYSTAPHTHPWADITGEPTTLTGFGLKAEADGLYAPINHVHASEFSVVTVGGKFQLVNDAGLPGAGYYYGTDDSGQKGYHPLPASGGNYLAKNLTAAESTDIGGFWYEFTDSSLDVNGYGGEMYGYISQYGITYDYYYSDATWGYGHTTTILQDANTYIHEKMLRNNAGGNMREQSIIYKADGIAHKRIAFMDAGNNIVGDFEIKPTGVYWNGSLLGGGGGGGTTYGAIDSLELSGSNFKLVGDNEFPGPDMYYGTDVGGTKGFHPIPTAGGGGGGDMSAYLLKTEPAGVELYAFGDKRYLHMQEIAGPGHRQLELLMGAIAAAGDQNSAGYLRFYSADTQQQAKLGVSWTNPSWGYGEAYSNYDTAGTTGAASMVTSGENNTYQARTEWRSGFGPGSTTTVVNGATTGIFEVRADGIYWNEQKIALSFV